VTCREAIALLSDYLDAVLGEDALRALEDHLQGCAPCVAYLNTYRRTRQVAATVNRVEMPEEMKQRLHDFLLQHLLQGDR
jgi:anti-sigma factor RsiW